MPGKIYRFNDINKIVDGDEQPEEIPVQRPEKPLPRLEQNKLRKQREEQDAHPDQLHSA